MTKSLEAAERVWVRATAVGKAARGPAPLDPKRPPATVSESVERLFFRYGDDVGRSESLKRTNVSLLLLLVSDHNCAATTLRCALCSLLLIAHAVLGSIVLVSSFPHLPCSHHVERECRSRLTYLPASSQVNAVVSNRGRRQEEAEAVSTESSLAVPFDSKSVNSK